MSIPDAERVTGRIFITGSTGFVGRNLRAQLSGRPMRLLVRDASKHAGLKSANVEIVEGDVQDRASLAGKMTGCDAVIHLVAIIDESADATFDLNIRQGTENVVAEAKAAGIKRFIHMSAMGAHDNPAFPYHQSKFRAEQAVKGSGIPWTILRPSVIFGPGDGFINALADVVRAFPVIPVVGTGASRFQPVSVKEVAECFVAALDNPDTADRIIDIGGPDVVTYEEMIDTIAKMLGKKKPKVHVPLPLMKTVVAMSKPLPAKLRPPVTSEQLKMLALDNTSKNSGTPELIKRTPLALRDGIDYIVTGG